MQGEKALVPLRSVRGGSGALFLPYSPAMVSPVILRFACLAAGFAAVLFAVSTPSLAQSDPRALIERLDRLERDMNLLQRQVYRGGGGTGGAPAPSDPSAVLNTELRMDQLETQMRTLTGQVEETNYQLDQLKQRLEKLVSDVDLRLSSLEKGGGAGEAARTPPPPPGRTPPSTTAAPVASAIPVPGRSANDPMQAPTTSGVLGTLPTTPSAQGATQQAARPPGGQAQLPAGSSQEQYNYAFGLLRQADYPGAEQALRQFLQRYPNDPLAGNAQYWLGETYYVRKDYNNAAIAFAEGYRKYPNGGKGPDSLLKLGMSLSEVGQKPQACQALGQIEREFPKASANLTERAKAERQRLECDRAR
jgi:tol-pal system protein YbgF